MFNDKLQVLLLSGMHKRGDAYPEIDFSEVQAHGIANKAKYIACSNEEIKQQIDERLAQSPSENEVPYFFYKVFHNDSSGNNLTKTFINVDTDEADDGFGNKWKDHVTRIAKSVRERKDPPIMLNKDVDLQKLINEKVDFTPPDLVVMEYVNSLYEKGIIDKNGKYILKEVQEKQEK